MDAPLANFVDALRAQNIPVSISETLDAVRTVDLIGYRDRSLLKQALGGVVAKTIPDREKFDQCFERFFSSQMFDHADEQPQSETDNQDTAGAEGAQESDAGDASGSEGCEAPPSDAPSSLSNMLLANDAAGLSIAMAEAAADVNLGAILMLTQRGLFTRRIMEQMGLRQLNDDIQNAEQADDAALAAELSEGRARLFEQARNRVEQQLALTGGRYAKELRQDVLTNISLANIEARDFKHMRELVRRMAKRLTDINSRIRKVKNRGHLDIRKTLRRNVAYDGLLFETHWKEKRKERPKVMAICDVSGSVAAVSKFMLMFLYSMNEVLPKVRSFAFSGQLGEVTELFDQFSLEQALPMVQDAYGGRSTDYGKAFEDFKSLALNDIDNKTTVIILGDGRSNNTDPRIDIIKEIKKRSKRVLWLNPERKSIWGSGDSEMSRYAPYCSKAEVCNSLHKLDLIIRDILKTS